MHNRNVVSPTEELHGDCVIVASELHQQSRAS